MSTANDTNLEQKDRSQVDLSRRTFAKSGVGLAPVVMLLANRPAWANGNMCSQSGFASFHNNNGVVSHVTHIKNPDWCIPDDSTGQKGWCQRTTWPTGYGRCSKNTRDSKHYSSHWSGGKTYNEVRTFESRNSLKCLASTMLPDVCSGNYDTLYDAMKKQDLNAYRIASCLNHVVSPMPDYLLTANCSLAEYKTFYENCWG